MTKKDEIIMIAADLIHEYGYNNIGIKRILDEANIPKGSFYHYFKSKEDLALAVIEFHIENTKIIFNEIDRSIEGLRSFFNIFFMRLEEMEYKRGCPVGNLILELADLGDSYRNKLLEWLKYLEDEIVEILENSEIKERINPRSMASFIVTTFEGAIMKVKLEKTRTAIDEFDYYIFQCLLK
ncbi:TetR family transcriptional regulator C-terminal domain-containing protein [Wukongibacter baidiensis]|uniref:TetR/AcrR family transcriptional regulator n=1 Tax=Wukongibacter baidiensis TaxID=1723361 RepID=UPI003D7FB89F